MSQVTNTHLLLTGASGFLGTEIIKLCQAAGTPLRSVSRKPLSREDHVCLDLSAETLPASLFAGVDTVIHAAGLAHQFGSAADDEAAFMAVNATAAETMIRAAAANGAQHFVLISSSGVYGPQSDMRIESDPCRPQGHYAVSKFRGEELTTQVAKETGIKLTILRMTTLYGEGDRGNLNRLTSAIQRKRFINIGKGDNRKSLIYKQDAARACLLAAAKTPVEKIQHFNVANEPVAMSQVVASICDSLGCARPWTLPASLVTGIASVASAVCLGKGPFARVKGTVAKWLSDDTFSGAKFAEHFGYAPNVPLSEGIDRQVKHFLNQAPSK